MKRDLILGTIAALWLACPSPAQQLQKITVNFPTRSGASWPIFMAKEGGYYQKYGLDVTTKLYSP
jgi:ABC-type nitrate/sulfonate/bicarbonate transport system substrate-binding protein